MCHRHDPTPKSDEIHSKLILKLNIIHLLSSSSNSSHACFYLFAFIKRKSSKGNKYAKRTEAVDNDDDDDSIFWLMMRQISSRIAKRKGWRGRKILYYLIIIRISFIPFHFLHFTWRWCWVLITIAWVNAEFFFE